MPPRKKSKDETPTQVTEAKASNEVPQLPLIQPTQKSFASFSKVSEGAKISENSKPINSLLVVTDNVSVNPIDIDERKVPHEEIKDSIAHEKQQQSNPNDFYLYWDLKNKAANKPRLENAEMDELLRLIKMMDLEGNRLLYVLCRMYSLKTGSSKIFDLPYGAKKLKEYGGQFDMEFDLKNIPNTLQRMLLFFCRMHLDNMKVNSTRSTTYYNRDRETFSHTSFHVNSSF
jgi:hypothetical protein